MLLIRTAVAAIGRIGSNRVGRRRRGKVIVVVMMQIGRSSSIAIAIALRGAPLLINGHGRRGAIAAVIMILMHTTRCSSRRWSIKQVPRNIRIVATVAAVFAGRHETGRIARVQPLTDD